MIKAILFDLDGVVINKKGKLFSLRVSEEMGFPHEQVVAFFTDEFRECSFGRADLKEILTPHLVKWGYKGSVEDFLKYWFEGEGGTNKEVLEIVETLRSKGIKCCIATRQEKYRKEYLLNVLGLKDMFDGIFCTCDIGYDKWQEEYWNYVFRELKAKPDEIVFICDTQKNIDSAGKLGIKAYFYSDIQVLKDVTKEFIG